LLKGCKPIPCPAPKIYGCIIYAPTCKAVPQNEKRIASIKKEAPVKTGAVVILNIFRMHMRKCKTILLTNFFVVNFLVVPPAG
jgi:hypothetical protein